MSIEQRPNNTVAIVCDTTTCHMEVLGRIEAEAKEDANLIGWSFQDGGKRHVCSDCAAGRNTSAIAQHGTDVGTVPKVTIAYQKGDPYYAPDGTLLGHAAEACKPGDDLQLKIAPPEPAAQPSQHVDPDDHPGPVFEVVEQQLPLGLGEIGDSCPYCDHYGRAETCGTCSGTGTVVIHRAQRKGDEAPTAEPQEHAGFTTPAAPANPSPAGFTIEDSDDDLFGNATSWNPSKGSK